MNFFFFAKKSRIHLIFFFILQHFFSWNDYKIGFLFLICILNIAAAVIIQLENSQKNLAIFAIFKFKKWYSQISCKLFFSLTSNYFFQLWEKSQLDNSKLNDELARTRDELSAAKKKLDTVVQVGKKVWFLIFFFFFFFFAPWYILA